MRKIKLLKVGTTDADGTQSFQSQLYIGRGTIDFIMRADGIMRCWGKGNNSFDFYEYTEPYEIVTNPSNMAVQNL